MHQDKYGRRLISVPVTLVPSQLLVWDGSSDTFWLKLADTLGIENELSSKLGYMSVPPAQAFLKSELPQGPFFAEVFAHDYGLLSLGSSRHIERDGVVWKGVGRNQLAVRSDLKHSWGGMTLAEGIEEFCFSLKLRPTQSVIPVRAVGKYLASENGPDHFLIREMILPRLASVPVQFQYPPAVKVLASDYEAHMGESSWQAWQGILARTWKLFTSGWVNPRLSIANFDIAARVLDLLGSYYFQNCSEELINADVEGENKRIHVPLDGFLWIIEHGFAPLHAQLWGLEPSQLIKLARDFFYERSFWLKLSSFQRIQQFQSQFGQPSASAWFTPKGIVTAKDLGFSLRREIAFFDGNSVALRERLGALLGQESFSNCSAQVTKRLWS